MIFIIMSINTKLLALTVLCFVVFLPWDIKSYIADCIDTYLYF